MAIAPPRINNTSIATTSCAIISDDKLLCNLLTMSLRHIGFTNIESISGENFSNDTRWSSDHGLVICAATGAAEPLRLLNLIRNDASERTSSMPVMCVIGEVIPHQLEAILNAGANCVITLPISSSILLRNVNRALSDRRNFVASEDDRGPCRRRGGTEYDGPLRHTTDGRAGPQPAEPPTVRPREAATRPTAEAASREKAPVSERTQTLIGGVRQVVATIERLRATLASLNEGPARKALHNELIDAAQRLVNLMALADTRTEHNNDIDYNLRKTIESTQKIFFDMIEQIAKHRLDRINTDILSVTSRNEISLGCSDLFARKLIGLEEVFSVMEGRRKFSDSMRRSLASAWDAVSRIEATETEMFKLHDFSNSNKHTNLQKHASRTIQQETNRSVGSQREVSKIINMASADRAH